MTATGPQNITCGGFQHSRTSATESVGQRTPWQSSWDRPKLLVCSLRVVSQWCALESYESPGDEPVSSPIRTQKTPAASVNTTRCPCRPNRANVRSRVLAPRRVLLGTRPHHESINDIHCGGCLLDTFVRADQRPPSGELTTATGPTGPERPRPRWQATAGSDAAPAWLACSLPGFSSLFTLTSYLFSLYISAVNDGCDSTATDLAAPSATLPTKQLVLPGVTDSECLVREL